jgi:hypothetical protein
MACVEVGERNVDALAQRPLHRGPGESAGGRGSGSDRPTACQTGRRSRRSNVERSDGHRDDPCARSEATLRKQPCASGIGRASGRALCVRPADVAQVDHCRDPLRPDSPCQSGWRAGTLVSASAGDNVDHQVGRHLHPTDARRRSHADVAVRIDAVDIPVVRRIALPQEDRAALSGRAVHPASVRRPEHVGVLAGEPVLRPDVPVRRPGPPR